MAALPTKCQHADGSFLHEKEKQNTDLLCPYIWKLIIQRFMGIDLNMDVSEISQYALDSQCEVKWFQMHR